MTQEQLIGLQEIFEEFEEENSTGKVILFFKDGILQGAEIDKKVLVVIKNS